ncbi:hypothetical protein [Actinomyces howellii]|uniref:Nitroreductase family n=1 Tax=Actinomyces howellii TaxID=52771 RepID=A0A448HHX8_9ACTO|nr:hypothetical protein [Actinomyces howellii]VEG28618.1 Uncharacterised protein [Actinomyces howellii]
MRSDYQTLTRIIEGFSASSASPAGPAAVGRTRRPLTPLRPEVMTLADLAQAGAPAPHDLRSTLERRSSRVDYADEPVDARALMSTVHDALVEDLRRWGRDAPGQPEPFVLLLRATGLDPGVYRVRAEGVDLLAPLPPDRQLEGLTVQKEFARAGAIVSAAADLDEADAWAGAHGYRHAMVRCAGLIYSVHLRAAAQDLTGTVFAGLASAAVRHLLDSDGVARHQMFAVTVAVPGAPPRAAPEASAPPAEPAPPTDPPGAPAPGAPATP